MGPTIRFQTRDPRERTRVDAYLECDGQLVQVLEVDYSGVLAEDVRTRIFPDLPRAGDVDVPDAMVEIDPVDLMQKWHPTTPDPSASLASWRAEHPA